MNQWFISRSSTSERTVALAVAVAVCCFFHRSKLFSLLFSACIQIDPVIDGRSVHCSLLPIDFLQKFIRCTGDWRISPEERLKYDSFFQQCGPVQGFLSGEICSVFSLEIVRFRCRLGEQARDFFIKSNLPPDVLRKIWCDIFFVFSRDRLTER